ncbi:hypothetical protein PTNB73_08520 [Pyrenophora teres f. teres]|uniref:Uncharacterized protein n=2 Tax=Pyrenophora teres f. teres TaxID=97479 RepID=E3S7R2_PYRTT|nr:hypothetical protein PTT_18893 [Pyrenophora teres f. teres 0-1]KAE8825521.1 hypothetical protein HRS9139_08631 [Pyrenophora teres f. teres]KAE8834617.1 hypothetical protein PTNB85_05950 [Pyrenophora teres f. teres]KAE8843902.1 hypothetical protein HRS9122_05005 [Pyrenophora teres f. teres]KAE8859040.1 hypothetical protein PTNB73_08520 [Pyrenophora teres f. teres]
MKFTVVLVALFASVAVAGDSKKKTCGQCNNNYEICMFQQCPSEKLWNNSDCDRRCQLITCGEDGTSGKKRNDCASKCDFSHCK